MPNNPYEKKARLRGSSRRRQSALAEQLKAAEALEARIRAERELFGEDQSPAPPLRVERRAYLRPASETPPEAPQPKPRKAPALPPPDPAKQAQWPLGDARQLIRDGYRLPQVIRMTGYPAHMLED
jgi:hypothetical protein